MAGPYLTMAEIEAKYPNEWVFLANPKVSKRRQILGGVVVFHSPDKVEFYRLMAGWDDPGVKHTASWYTGRDVGDGFEPAEAEPGAA